MKSPLRRFRGNAALRVCDQLSRFTLAMWLGIGWAWAIVGLVMGMGAIMNSYEQVTTGWQNEVVLYSYLLFVMMAPFALGAIGLAVYRLMFPMQPKVDDF